MTDLTLESLGLSRDEIADRVCKRAAEILLANHDADEPSFNRRMEETVREKVDDAIDAIAARNVLPNIEQYVEGLVLQRTNQWGEAKGKQMTFVEYLVERAETYMTETVDFDGHTRGEARGSYWKGTQTRVAHMIDRHLHYSIETAMKGALQDANSKIAQGIEETVKLKLQELLATLKVDVGVKR